MKGLTTVTDTATIVANNANNKVIYKNCAPFTEYISKISNALVDYAKDIDVVRPMFNLIECSEIYLKILGSLWQYFGDEPALDDNGNINDFTINDIDLFKFNPNLGGLLGFSFEVGGGNYPLSKTC